MTVATAFAVIGAVAGVAGAVQGGKAASAGKSAARARAEIAKLENARTRRNVVKEERIAQGTVLARAATIGGGGGFGGLASSSRTGQTSSLKSQLTSNLTHLRKAEGFNEIANVNEINASGFQGQAALFAGISSAANSAGALFAPSQ